MFCEIMSAFSEVAEMKKKNSEKRALFSIKCSRGVLSFVDKIENWKNTKEKKTISVDEKEKYEVNLHAALVLNITYWAIYEPRRDKGFQQQSEVIFCLRQQPGEKNHLASKLN